MKKYILILILFLLTGCTTNYNLTIDENSILEDVSVGIPKSSVDYNTFLTQAGYSREVYYAGNAYYNSSSNSDENNYYINYNYSHDPNNYTKSNFIKKCYTSNKIVNTEDIISIATSDRFNCIKMEDGFYMDSVTVNIKTDLSVTKNNADKVSGNTYTWIINKDNYLKKPINIEINKLSSEEMFRKNVANGDGNSILIMFTIVLSLFALIVYIFTRIRHSKNNVL